MVCSWTSRGQQIAKTVNRAPSVVTRILGDEASAS